MTKIEDFLKICRACNSEKTNLLNLFAVDCENEPTLGQKFSTCTSLIVVENDDYPPNICYSCAKLLEEAYKFNKMCHNTEMELRKRLSDVKIIPDIEEPSEEPVNFCEVERLDSPIYLDESFEDEDHSPDMPKAIKQEVPEEIEILEEEDIPAAQMKLTTQTSSSPGLDRQYVCKECDKKFFTSKALELHNKVHHKRRSRTKVQSSKSQRQSSLEECTDCDLLFGSRDEYRDHVRMHHSNESDDNTCEICGKRLRNKIAFKNHLKVHEADNRPYACNVCGKEYTEYRYMYRHMLYHKPTLFRCTEKSCTRTYTVKHKLVDHLRRHHEKYLTNNDVRKIEPETLNRDGIASDDYAED